MRSRISSVGVSGAALLLLAAALSGCGGDNHDDLAQYVSEVKARQRGHVAPLPEFTPYQTYRYLSEDGRDPFAPPVRERPRSSPENSVRPDQQRAREPLEEVPLDALKLVGSIANAAGQWAIIRAPDGVIHRVRPGNYVGQNFGRIDLVSEHAVHITEIIPDGMGGWLERQASLTLSE